ncbi:MAG TPA: hypothetical protein VMF87_25775 [Streptosporangiaceae bacterium]|nr:hypothetical protein [Streptosporangiaceae bacterium]
MRRDDVRFAAAARDDGLRKISKLTWRAGAAGVLCSAAIAVAFGHHVAAQQQPAAGVHGGTGGASSSTGSASTGTSGSASTGSASTGTGSQGTSGSTGSGTSGSGSQGTIGVPAQPPAPASGGGQVTSGGT